MERIFSVIPVITKDDNPEISLSVIDIKGVNRYVVNTENTAVYQCLKGRVTFAINRSGVFSFVTLDEGESIKIPSETPYLDFSQKGATLIVINKKAFDSAQVVELPVPAILSSNIKTRFLLTPTSS